MSSPKRTAYATGPAEGPARTSGIEHQVSTNLGLTPNVMSRSVVSLPDDFVVGPDFEILGSELPVPLVTGDAITYANLDYAASAPCLRIARDAVIEALPWYSSVHRGAGLASQVTTARYEQARESIRRFLVARAEDSVIFTRNTTDSLNLLARVLPADCEVLVFDTEHHAALLPWPASRVTRLAAPGSPEEAVSIVADTLRQGTGNRLLCVTGASNVTGELWPVGELVALAHGYGARVVMDAAQLAPHCPIDMSALDVDYLAFSGHKLYAPFGAGVLVGRSDWLNAAEPYLLGGGATRRVLDSGVEWADTPERHEAGTPNVLGAIALAAVCDGLSAADRFALHAAESALTQRLRAGLGEIEGVMELALWKPEHERIGVMSFAVQGWSADYLAAALSAEYGIGVRDGAFCAHPCVRHLFEKSGRQDTTAVRASLGIGSTVEHVDRCIDAIRQLVRNGPRWTYAECEGRIRPLPDPRSLPRFV